MSCARCRPFDRVLVERKDDMLKLEALDAMSGDCLLLHHGPDDAPGLILIDGGMPGAYLAAIKPRLLSLREERDPQQKEPLPLGLVVITHVDEDHIGGISEMFDELRRAKDGEQPRFCEIGEVWFNAFDDLAKHAEWKRVENAASAGLPEGVAIVASIKQGAHLRDTADYLGMDVNESFSSKFAACPKDSCLSVEWDDLEITLLAPTSHELEAFEADWRKWLASKAKGSAVRINESSIALLITAKARKGQERTLLLPGDTHEKIVMQQLETLGFLPENGQCTVDVLKLPHHGSCRNVTQKLFERVLAREYLICADGSDGNPDEKTLDWLWDARGAGDYTVHVTFPRDASKKVKGTSKKEKDRAEALERAQKQLDGFAKKGMKVEYGEPGPSRVTLDLSARASPRRKPTNRAKKKVTPR